jgi:hypothetical protein|tara:strand:- start:967 stop:1257 length:291 start_codon:yes stop_codon:yes gene_type:complete
MYKKNSPWSKTNIIDDTILDLITFRSIFPDPYDVIYTIPAKYDERPDLCSYEMYGTAKYWWIFAARNPNDLIDPIRDFSAGIKIFIPNKDNISNMV